MSLSVKMTEITLQNFIGIYTGIGKKKLTINLEKLLDKDIILILGDNGTGKSTLSSVLHPLPGTTDKRNKFIREDKEGSKVVKYVRSDGVKYTCKLVYTPSKTGHNTKGYITKEVDDEKPIELNPNGNISSYKEILFEELGVSDAILRLSSQNDVCKGHVDMTSTERKINMSAFLPEDIYSHSFAIVDKTYREMKTRISILVDAIGKLDDEETIKTNIKSVTQSINELVAKRDKYIGKIKELETRIKIINEDGDIEKREKKAIQDLNSSNKELSKIAEKIKKIYDNYLSDIIDSDESSKGITKTLESVKKDITQDKMNYEIIENKINSLKLNRNEISEEISSKEVILKDISSNHTLNELKDILSEYKVRFTELDKLISKLDTNLSKEDLMVGYEIVRSIRSIIERVHEDVQPEHIDEVIDNFNDFSTHQNKLEKLYEKRIEYRNIQSELGSRLSLLSANSNELKESRDKRPSECTIDNCPFLENARKWEAIENEASEISDGLDKVNDGLEKLNNNILELEQLIAIYNMIVNGWNYIITNMPIIKKLPYNEKYSSLESFLNVIQKGDMLPKCDKFDGFIEVLESKEEYQDLKYNKIPSIEHEIRILETQGKLILSARDDLKRLSKQEESIKGDIEDLSKKLSMLSETIDFKETLIEKLEKFYEKRIDYESLYKVMQDNYNEIKKIQSLISESNEYKSKLKERKDKLREVEGSLNPLTKQREFYKMEQLKILDHKQEMASMEEDMYKCSIIRDSLSVKDDGIPVDVLEFFMDTVRQNANALLSSTFNGALYLEEFEIDSRNFFIPYKKNGDRGIDVSFASSSERSFISLCLTLAIMEEIISTYGILILDEIDRGFSDHNKYKFIQILGNQIRRVGITQTFMTTHNREYYEGFDLGYILFPGHSLTKYNDNDVIKVYE